MLVSGYLKAEQIEYRGVLLEPWYHLRITNLETTAMFTTMFKGWFAKNQSNYNQFMKALLSDDIDAMNYYMNQIIMTTFSYFDVGQNEPERFYHGFVLGLIVDLAGKYRITSNRESGFGRYDVIMEPLEENLDAIIMEFKVQNTAKEKSLEQTVQNALRQIEEKQYDIDLLSRGITKERIRHYGFAFRGKKVLIGNQGKFGNTSEK